MIDVQKLLVGLATEAMSGPLKPQRRASGRRRSRTVGASQGKIIMGLLGLALSAFERYAGSATDTPPAVSAEAKSGAVPVSEPQTINPEQLLLLRAMVAAAHADGVLDPSERTTIVQQLESATLSSDERTFIAQELSTPHPVGELVAAATTEVTRSRVFAAAALAIAIDTDAERRFIDQLGAGLGLSAEQRATLIDQVSALKQDN